VTITSSPERARASPAGTVAFYVARMGTYYSEQLARYGFGDDVARVKQAWDADGSKAGVAAVSEKLLTELAGVTPAPSDRSGSDVAANKTHNRRGSTGLSGTKESYGY